MPNENRKALATLRLEQASSCIKDAEIMLGAASYKTAANRAYYCVFHAMRAVLAIDCFDSRKHSGVIAAFRERYIKTGIFPTGFSDIIKQSFDIRGKSDYEDFFEISKEETSKQVEEAKSFLITVEAYIKTIIAEPEALEENNNN